MDSNTIESTSGRPAVLESASETQILELERQFEQGDRDGWDNLVESYGWSAEDGAAAWTWFDEKPSEGSGTESTGGYSGDAEE